MTIRQRREEHGVFGLVIDKTDAYNEIVRLRNISQHDQLTGLYNSSYLKKEGQKILDENANRVNALVFCDLDNLKYINDNFGHEMGDRYLKAMADLLTSMTQGEQCIAVRLSGDEFVLFFYGYDNRDVIEQKVRDGYAGRPSLRLPDGTDHRINASIGLAYAQRETESMDGLLNRADRAMYRVKHGEKNGIAIYDKSDEAGPA
ncbi:GGDEF domain-containing protein [Enterocloster citroniae]|uniref:GGDEF domain-containing protein n=1 Tax=Enterocloster citroniae TaxID=358743 RepID=UPI00349EE918